MDAFCCIGQFCEWRAKARLYIASTIRVTAKLGPGPRPGENTFYTIIKIIVSAIKIPIRYRNLD